MPNGIRCQSPSRMRYRSLTRAIFVAAVSVCTSAPLGSGQFSAAASDLAIGQQAAGGRSSARTPSSVVLKVHVLLTSDGADPAGDGRYADRYPKTIRVEASAAISNRISAYGAAYRVWVAPKGWTGTAAVGGDSSTDVDLHPPNGSASRGPRFHYENSGGCAGCALDGAAPYFPAAMQRWTELFGYDKPAPLSSDLKIVRVSQELVMYSSSNARDLLMRGVATSILPSHHLKKPNSFCLVRTRSY